MKYIILVGDGMADLPLSELEGKTPLSAAVKPAMDYIASKGINGRVSTVPEGMVPESDTANLAIMGYDPKVYSKGRSPLEAASIGIKMQADETAIRANVVCLSEEETCYEDRRMIDHSAGEITTEEADELIKAVQAAFGNEYRTFYTGVSYRHCLIWKDCPDFTDFSRPHDIIGRRIGDHAPVNFSSQAFWELQKASFDLLNHHPVNLARAAAGKRKANSLWFWSPGKKPALPSFEEKTGLKASVVCAVDLIRGIGLWFSESRLGEIHYALLHRIDEAKLSGAVKNVLFTHEPLLLPSEFKLNRRKLASRVDCGEIRTFDPRHIDEHVRELEAGMEREIATCFADALGIDCDSIGPDDDFFRDLNGTSLDYFTLLSHLKSRLGVDVMTSADKKLSSVRAFVEYIKASDKQ